MAVADSLNKPDSVSNARNPVPASRYAKVRYSTDASKYPSEAAAVNSFWTPSRVKKALAANPGFVESLIADRSTNAEARKFLLGVPGVKSAPATQPEADNPHDASIEISKTSRQIATLSNTEEALTEARKKVGVLLFTDNDGDTDFCTGFSINPGRTMGVVQTAAHCIRDDAGEHQNFFFIPEYGVSWDPEGDVPTGPWGGFPAQFSWTGWNGGTGPVETDYGFLRMHVNADGESLAWTAGALRAAVAEGVPNNFQGTVMGYDTVSAEQPGLSQCDGVVTVDERDASTASWHIDGCRADYGNSGGPVFICADICGEELEPVVVGDISRIPADEARTSGPLTGSSAWALYADAADLPLTATYPGDNVGSSDPVHDELRGIPSASATAPRPNERTAYYTSWSVYANQFYPKHLDTQGIAGKLTTLNYAFENIDPINLTCMEANKAGSSDDNDITGNDGAGDAWADYQMGFTSDNSVDGSTDTWDQPLKGNFNQLKQLKVKYPNLKVLVSLGGWTYSKYFSDVAATDTSRKKFVSSCIDMYIKGNLPVLDGSPAGGQGAAAGVFDGFDIDWEFPGSTNGHPGNHVSAADTANYTLLLQEFRRELDALGGKHYTLTAAVPSGPGEIAKIQPGSLAGALDMANVMTYDFYGAWNPTGPTNFNSQLTDSAANPDAGAGFSVEDAINAYISGGMPADKLTVGIPLYARGWTGVSDGGTHGLYQSATGPSPAYSLSQQPGVAFYKELRADGKLNAFWMDPTTKSTWAYDGTNWWSVETPQSISYKLQYVASAGLAGVMLYSLEGDDANSTLVNAALGGR
ncbi:glycosyl hydrolase family 18 protein [Streptomyces sp. enrichment culture]|uniref:glycosyl hydrolase family 18 protein n=1 Tax=Streptomyces sp. enrichment culture TaxID=1795815 RepID=UPI003F561560